MNYLYKSLLFLAFFCFTLNDALRANNSAASAITIDHNQKLVIVGTADNGTTNDFALARLNLDGSRDVTFNPTGSVPGQTTTDIQGTNSAVAAVAIDENNKIVVAGTSMNLTVNPASGNNEIAVARYNDDGSLDMTFNAAGTLPGGPGVALISIATTIASNAFALALDSQGRIVVAGTTDTGFNTEMVVIRLTPDGHLDPTFTGNIFQPGILVININNNQDVAFAVTIGANDSIFVAGYSTTNTGIAIALAKVTAIGVLDRTFVNVTSPFPGVVLQTVSGVDDEIHAMGLDSNGNLVLGGFTVINSISNFLIVRYTQTGVLFETIVTSVALPPTTVNPVSNIANTAINALAFDSENRIIASGSYDTQANLAFLTARYNLDGSLDVTFNPMGNAGSIASQPGTLITNVLPPPNQNFFSNDNQALGVTVDAKNNIYPTGYANDSVQTNFTTLSYLPTGALNIFGFNQALVQTGTQGIVFNVFFGERALGNGVPLFLGGDTSFLGPEVMERLTSNLLSYVTPLIYAKGPLVTNEIQPTISGIASPNATITLLINDVPMASTMADFKGEWSTALTPLLDGTYTVIAIATDPLSSITLASQPVSLTINTEIPASPVIEVPAADAVVRTANVTIQGKAKPGTVVGIFIENRQIGEAKVQPSGTWSFTSPSLIDGPQRVYAVAQDKAGNLSAPSEEHAFLVDTGKPQAPRILTPTQGVIVRKMPLVITGEGKPNSTISVFANDKRLAPVKVDKSGNWSYTGPLEDGDYSIRATADSRLSSEIIKFTIDTKPARSVAGPTPAGTGLFNGRAQPGNIVTLYLDGTPLASIAIDQSGSWSYTPPALAKGQHSLKISIADKSGAIISVVDRQVTV